MRAFARFAWAVLAYHVAVIGWGALVRATGSGAGCGQHWPMCNGAVVPRSPALETVIEFTHRATSGVALVLVVALVAWSRRAHPRGHPARRAAAASLGFLVAEALLGAGLVLFGWVAKDASAGRGWVMALHLANTFLLLAALTLTAGWSVRPGRLPGRGSGMLPALVLAGLALAMLTGVTGAIAALGDTLFPATSFAAGLRQDLDRSASVLLRLRLLHPLFALVAGGVLGTTAWLAAARQEGPLRRAGRALGVLVGLQLGAGVANLFLLAPVWLQVGHLALADLVWVALVLVGGWEAPVAEAAAARRDEPAHPALAAR